jgi:hypothetical protein
MKSEVYFPIAHTSKFCKLSVFNFVFNHCTFISSSSAHEVRDINDLFRPQDYCMRYKFTLIYELECWTCEHRVIDLNPTRVRISYCLQLYVHIIIIGRNLFLMHRLCLL